METTTKKALTFPYANGVLELPLGWRGAWYTLKVHGGPFPHFKRRDDNTLAVCLLEKEPKDYDIWFPIVDFSVPKSDTATVDTLGEVLAAALTGKHIYVGCMAGRGRTGLFLALLAKVAGQSNPVEYVRANYYPHAVETPKQYAYVTDFDTTGLTQIVHRAAWKHRLKNLFR